MVGEWACQDPGCLDHTNETCNSFEQWSTVLIGRSRISEDDALRNLLNKTYVDLEPEESVAQEIAWAARVRARHDAMTARRLLCAKQNKDREIISSIEARR